MEAHKRRQRRGKDLHDTFFYWAKKRKEIIPFLPNQQGIKKGQIINIGHFEVEFLMLP